MGRRQNKQLGSHLDGGGGPATAEGCLLRAAGWCGCHQAVRQHALTVFVGVAPWACRYVQCYDCGNPETVVKIKKEFIYLKCKACGCVRVREA